MHAERTSGPFFITTKRPDDRTGPSGERSHVELVSRRAVATLEEARLSAQEIVRAWRDEDGSRTAWELAYDFLGECEALSDSGGTVGPLPDGTVIEVERAEAFELWRAAGEPFVRTRQGRTVAQIIDAYNARHA